ncbi:MAG: aldo/keto reductase [Erysipelotrichaceae bacterium]|nr:aldo/keto reductase [Erysipelotrichaceae bacterium]
MEYRKLPHGDEMISVIGMGTSVVAEDGVDNAVETFKYAIDHGINYFDFAGGHAAIFEAMGKAMKGQRDKVMLQVHFGADYTSGEYGWNMNLDAVKKSVEWQLKNLDTDYIDFGFMHCLDEDKDMDTYINNGVLDYLMELKNKGVVRHLGMSTHSPHTANRVLDMGIVDMIMFSINPMYDYEQGDYSIGKTSERYELYQRCEKEGVGISVMKPFNAGQLLDEKKSPFHQALTPVQCIAYVLDRPGVLTVMQGAKDIDELKENLKYLEASEEEKDYSIIGSFTPEETKGKCVYCKHCHPCPMGLDIGLINKYYDLSKLGDVLAKEHYLTLEKTAADCISCGHCDSRCPFSVNQSERMKEIEEYFGK